MSTLSSVSGESVISILMDLEQQTVTALDETTLLKQQLKRMKESRTTAEFERDAAMKRARSAEDNGAHWHSAFSYQLAQNTLLTNQLRSLRQQHITEANKYSASPLTRTRSALLRLLSGVLR